VGLSEHLAIGRICFISADKKAAQWLVESGLIQFYTNKFLWTSKADITLAAEWQLHHRKVRIG
jgi:hypothetical protein